MPCACALLGMPYSLNAANISGKMLMTSMRITVLIIALPVRANHARLAVHRLDGFTDRKGNQMALSRCADDHQHIIDAGFEQMIHPAQYFAGDGFDLHAD